MGKSPGVINFLTFTVFIGRTFQNSGKERLKIIYLFHLYLIDIRRPYFSIIALVCLFEAVINSWHFFPNYERYHQS